MAPPLPTVNVQGIGVVGADNLNTYVQTVANFAQLRTFSALDDMSVIVLGGASEGDGNQGIFWYDSISTAADNGSTVIVPTGNTQGAWLLLPPGSNSPGSFASLTVAGNGLFGGNLTVGGTLGVTGVATFAADILMTGTGEIDIPSGTTAQRSGSPNTGMIRYNTTLSQFEGYGSSGWQPLAGTGVATPPGGRLTLTSATPVLSATVTAASGLIYTPYLGNTVPQWNGTTWSSTVFAEISQALSDTTHSPAAAVANSLYDLFVWFNAGVATLSRGPVWTNSTTRAASLSRIQGFLTNTLAITNGPGAGYGLYVGTVMTDVMAAAVTFAPNPAAASGGPTTGSSAGNPGAWIGLWNQNNRVVLTTEAQDSKSSPWTYATASWRSSDGSNNNRITAVIGSAEDAVSATFADVTSGNDSCFIGIGIDSTTAPYSQCQIGPGTVAVAYQTQTVSTLTSIFSVGQHYLQALEYGASSGTFSGTQGGMQVHQISALLRF
jgi:hypothetical protein